MRCYKVTGGGLIQFAATQVQAKFSRHDIAERVGLKPKDVDIEQTDVPTDKTGLLMFMNELVDSLSDCKAKEVAEDAEEESAADTGTPRKRRRSRN